MQVVFCMLVKLVHDCLLFAVCWALREVILKCLRFRPWHLVQFAVSDNFWVCKYVFKGIWLVRSWTSLAAWCLGIVLLIWRYVLQGNCWLSLLSFLLRSEAVHLSCHLVFEIFFAACTSANFLCGSVFQSAGGEVFFL